MTKLVSALLARPSLINAPSSSNTTPLNAFELAIARTISALNSKSASPLKSYAAVHSTSGVAAATASTSDATGSSEVSTPGPGGNRPVTGPAGGSGAGSCAGREAEEGDEYKWRKSHNVLKIVVGFSFAFSAS